MVRLFKKLKGFIWDTANKDKSWVKHKVGNAAAEEVFFDSRYILLKDQLHSAKEPRFHIIGKTKSGKILTIAFTVRSLHIRIISARAASKRERNIYEKKVKST